MVVVVVVVWWWWKGWFYGQRGGKVVLAMDGLSTLRTGGDGDGGNASEGLQDGLRSVRVWLGRGPVSSSCSLATTGA